MADLKVTQLSDLGAMPATNDLIMVVDVSDTGMSAGGTNKKVTANYLGRSSGAVLYAQDGKALTLPASGTAAMLGSNTFVAGQAITPPAPLIAVPLSITMPTNAGTVYAALTLYNYDNGADSGPRLSILNNTNASTPASGCFNIRNMNNSNRFFWVDAAGLFRIHNAMPTYATDTAGSVVGDQTSSLAAKTIGETLSNLDAVWERIQDGAQAVRRFVYNSGAYNDQEFEGVVVDYAPAYGKDRDEEFPDGKALNEVTIIGDLLRAMADLVTRVLLLEGIALDSETPIGELTAAQRDALASLGGSLLARYGA
jgi:hypothetical protein